MNKQQRYNNNCFKDYFGRTIGRIHFPMMQSEFAYFNVPNMTAGPVYTVRNVSATRGSLMTTSTVDYLLSKSR
jgi:hypothetical protein